MRNKMGFTMVELLVGVVTGLILTTAAMSLYLTQHKQLLVQDSISDMQSSVRVSAAEIASKLRLAGYKEPIPSLALKASNTNPDTITIGLDADMACGPITLSASMPQPSSELKVAGDMSCIHDGDSLFIYDPWTGFGENFVATNVQQSAMHLQHNVTNLHERYPAGSFILENQHFYTYYIDQSNASHPNLMIRVDYGTPQIYAENITNLNCQYVLSSGAVVNVPTNVGMVREVIIRVDGRTASPDNEFQNQYRTRTLTTKIKVRNLGFD